MTLHKKTLALIDTAREVLEVGYPMTVRQVYYQLVSRQVIENSRAEYQRVSAALVEARKSGLIEWEWIEDRLRRPRTVPMWDDLGDFGKVVISAYRRDVWQFQDSYVEAWLEKDALSGIFEDVLRPYGVTLNVGRGYDGWSSIRNAAERFDGRDDCSILYFGDFDPSGEDMVRSLCERLAYFGVKPEIAKCALVAEDVARYNLPPDPAKRTDTRAARFMAIHGDVSVELDALPADVLRERIVSEVKARIDMDALQHAREIENTERGRLASVLTLEGE